MLRLLGVKRSEVQILSPRLVGRRDSRYTRDVSLCFLRLGDRLRHTLELMPLPSVASVGEHPVAAQIVVVVVEVGEFIQPEIALINRSKRASYYVVRPGDGSWVGWREPHVYYSAEIDVGDGRWQPIPRRSIAGRCGVYDFHWQRGIVELEPGETMNIRFPPPDRTLDFVQPGRVRLYVHYAYNRGNADRAIAPIDVGKMKGVPAFELISAPAEFELTRPLELRIVAKAPLRLGETRYLSEVLKIHLANRSDEARTILIRSSKALTVQFHGAHTGWEKIPNALKGGLTKTILKPGQELNLIGDDGPVFGPDWTWTHGGHVEPALKVRAARLHFTADDSSRLLTSNSVEIQLEH